MRKILIFFLIFCACSNSYAKQDYFYLERNSISPDSISPAIIAKSDELKQQINKVILVQKKVTLQDIKNAAYEHHFKPELLLRDFKNINKKNYPNLFNLLNKVHLDSKNINSNLKNFFKQKRPYQDSIKVKLHISPSKSYSYPSSHAAKSYVCAYVLAKLFPKLEKDFLKRAQEISQNRVIAGLHYPKDIKTGEKVAENIFAKLQNNKDYIADFNLAKKEIMAK